jgi:hypothetical protein
MMIDKSDALSTHGTPSNHNESNVDIQTIISSINDNDNNNNTTNTSYIKNNSHLLFNFLKSKRDKTKHDQSASELTTPQSTSKYLTGTKTKKRRSLSIINFGMKQRSESQLSETIDKDNEPDLAPAHLTLTNKLLNERNIYSDPKDNYKRRTLVIERKSTEQMFGFDVQVCIKKAEKV